MGTNKIVYAGQIFDDQKADNLLSGNCFIGNSLACDELTVDTLDATVDCSTEVPTIFAPADADGLLTIEDELFGVRPYLRLLVHDLSEYVYGEPVYYYRDDVLFSKFYMASVKRVSKYSYEITCTSAIGLLDNSTHYGGIYSGEPMEMVLADIIGGMVEYTLDTEFLGIAVYGWLPVATRRENLHQLLFAEGASVMKDQDGNLFFNALSKDEPSALTEDRIFLGGSVDYQTPATTASISEHAYVAYETDAIKTLYEGEVPTEPLLSPKGVNLVGALVLFDGPMHDLEVENGTILESGVNYAILGQSSDCKLIGKAFTHTTRVIVSDKNKTRGLVNLKDNEITVTDATLVSLANSENVAERVMAYYGHASQVNTNIVVLDERPGHPVSYINPFDEPGNGFIQSLDITMGNTLRAMANLVSGYEPTGIGNFYTHFMVLDRDQTWTVPPECKGKIRVVLIGGGQGGHSGFQGSSGEGGLTSVNGKGGAGGNGGQGGQGGKVLISTIPAVAGQKFSVLIGLGGEGGIMGENGASSPGAFGGATTFGDYTSEEGRPSETGYINIMDKKEYANSGTGGISGSKGSGSDGVGPDILYKGVTYTPGLKGATKSYSSSEGVGGYGGGAAAGANGSDGGDGDAYRQPNNSIAAQGGHGGKGGNGATGDTATTYGDGGQGGHGGGGGGGSGPAYSQSGGNYAFGGNGGDGGAGGQGGQGAQGCVIVYW